MPDRLRWKIGENEIEVEGDQAFIESQLQRFLQGVPAKEHPRTSTDLPAKIVVSATKPSKIPTPSEYFRQKQPQSGTERLIVFAKYLEEFQSQGEFTKEDMRRLCDQAKVKHIHPQYFTEAVKQGLLRLLGHGKYALSLSGEDVVVAMPAKPKG